MVFHLWLQQSDLEDLSTIFTLYTSRSYQNITSVPVCVFFYIVAHFIIDVNIQLLTPEAFHSPLSAKYLNLQRCGPNIKKSLILRRCLTN